MKKLIQSVALGAYRGVCATGLLETRLGKRLFTAAYDFYKQRFEAADADALRPWVQPGSTVIDVGANVGFFTLRFAQWVGEGGRVIAIEPEAENIRLLRQRIARAGLAARIEVVEGVAAEAPGTLNLVLNPHHPADHRIGASGVPVEAHTLDGLMRRAGWPAVSLVKIDVQGAEMRVIGGAQQTLSRFHPALFVEVDDAALAQAGTSADALFDALERHGYRAYALTAPTQALTRAQAAARRQALGYADYLFRAG